MSDKNVRTNLKFLRRATGMSLRDVSDLLQMRGLYVTVGELAATEDGTRAVSAAELAALCSIWGADPADMGLSGYPVFRA